MDQQRYSRHLILPQIGEEGQEKLLNSKVLIVGVGGLGSAISLYLTAAGVGQIGLIDADSVALSNLQRQVLYSSDEIGQSKVERAFERLRGLSPETKFDLYPYRLTAENADNIVKLYDVVVDGCDNYATRYLINDACIRQGKPYVYGSICAFSGQVSVFNYQNGVNYRDLYSEEDELIDMPNSTLGVMGVVPGIIGCMEAAETIKLITGCGDVLRNRLFTMDVLTMKTEIIEL